MLFIILLLVSCGGAGEVAREPGEDQNKQPTIEQILLEEHREVEQYDWQ